MRYRSTLSFVLLVAFSRVALGYDAFADELTPTHFVLEADHGLRLLLKGAARLTFKDLEGEGGLGRDSATDTTTIGTRSPHATFDGLDLALRLETEVGLGFRAAVTLRSDVRPTGAVIDYRAQLGPVEFALEAGLNYPMVARFWRTAREPITSRIYWGGQELHLVASARGAHWWSAGSVALMRPLGARVVNDASVRGTLTVLAYQDAAPFSGVSPVVGGLVGAGLGRAKHAPLIGLELFGYAGQLAAEGGVDELRNRIPSLQLHPRFKPGDPRAQSPVFFWGGGRVSLAHGSGAFAVVEGIASRESLLSRAALSSELGYRLRLSGELPRGFEFTVRLDHYRLFEGPDVVSESRALRGTDPSQAITWDWDTLTLALACDLYLDVIRLQLEHTIIGERNGAPALGIDDVQFANNETLLQLVLRF